MDLSWTKHDPRPDPFEAAVGETFVYVVHRAESTASSDTEIERDLEASIRKALPYARAAIDEPTAGGQPVAKLLVLWDVVNCDLVVVSSDESMMYDASQVVKCYFLHLEEERYGFSDENFDVEAAKRSAVIQKMLIKIFKNIDSVELPAEIPILFSDQDRASTGERFTAQSLING